MAAPLTKAALKEWTVVQLGEYLRKRGVVISEGGGRKDCLIDKVFYASQLGLKVLPSEADVRDDIVKRRQEKLTLDGVTILPPEQINSNWLTTSMYFPDTTLSDVEQYFTQTNSMKAFIEGKNIFASEHVSNIEYNNISNDVQQCYVRAKVVPATKVGSRPYLVWVCLNKDGSVMTAECGCLAGNGESCKHVAALLFFIEQEVKRGNNKSCTSKKQYWGNPPSNKKRKIHEPIKINDIKIKHIDTEEQNSDFLHTRSTFDPRPIPDRSANFTQNDWENLAKASNGNCALFKFIPTTYVSQMSLDKIKLPPTIPELAEQINNENPSASIKEKCNLLKEKMVLSPEECLSIKRATLDQHKSSLWHDYRVGRITASKAHEVIIKYDSNNSIRNIQAAQNLCATICGYKKSADSKSLQWGRQNESIARKKFRKDSTIYHKSFKCKESGLIISSSKPFLAASPDGEVTCKCHLNGLYEVKCPWKFRNDSMKEYISHKETFLEYDTTFFSNIIEDLLNKTFFKVGVGLVAMNKVKEAASSFPYKLKANHQYHTQVQHAMFVCDKRYCDFHVYLRNESFVQRITPVDYEKNIVKMDKFFTDFIAPEMFTRKLLSKEIVLAILKDIINSIVTVQRL